MPQGLLDAQYARGRENRPELIYRYRFRAQAAVAAAPAMKDGRLLDLGAAEGRTLAEMIRLGRPKEAWGVELAQDLVDRARELGNPVVHGDVEHLPEFLRGMRFDVVCALAVLEHLDHPEACLREAFSVLRSGGRFVASAPNPFWDRMAARAGLHKEQEHHVRAFDGRVFAKLATEAGFVNIRVRPFMFVGSAFVPYLGLIPPVSLAYRMEVPFAVPALGFAFVNQLFTADKP